MLGPHILADGRFIVSAAGTVIVYERPAFDVMLVVIAGCEDAALSDLFFDMLSKELAFDRRKSPREGCPSRIQLFVDARQATRHGLMYDAWIRLLKQGQQPLSRLHILAVNKVNQLSVEIIRHLSDSGPLVKLYTETGDFDAAMRPVVNRRMPLARRDVTVERLKRYLVDAWPAGLLQRRYK